MNSGSEALISVIVPAYNVERYLDKCLASIARQTYERFEVILVDDGSADGTGEIARRYQRQDARFRVIAQPNRGVSCARNTGLRHVRGRYIAFVDSDDTVTEDYLATLYHTLRLHGANASICGTRVAYDSELCVADPNQRDEYEVFNRQTALERLLYQAGFGVSLWGKLFEAGLFEGIFFPEGQLCEDTAVTYKVLARAGRIAFNHRVCYFYYQREGSIMNSDYLQKKMMLVDFAAECVDYVQRHYSAIAPAAVCNLVTNAFYVICNMSESGALTNEALRKCWRIIKTHRAAVLKDSKARRKTKFACLTSYLGPRAVVRIRRMRVGSERRAGARTL